MSTLGKGFERLIINRVAWRLFDFMPQKCTEDALGKTFHGISRQVQLTLHFASTWVKNHKLEFNAVKSRVMILEKRENNVSTGNLTLNGFSLDCVKKLKYLGFPPIVIFIIRNNEFKIATKNCTNKSLHGSMRVSELLHPSERFPLNLINYRKNIENNFPVVCFTDGKIRNKVGLAFSIFQEFIEIQTRQFRIRDQCGVFRAELLSIAQAVSCICNNEIISSNFVFCSDSLSSLCALSNINSPNQLIVKTHMNLNFLRSRGVQVFFYFVRGHMGIYRYERADWLAKEATKLSNMIPMSIPKSYHKKVSKENIISEGNNLYQISNNAHLTKELIPSIQNRLKAKHFQPKFKLTQFLTGHGNFKAYLKRFNLSPTDQCSSPVTQSRMLCI
ncbi:RNase H domain-containing protein [Trichonephila clavipes]|nr:RNase H domain-containing protein [Trichonephila clavipes]